MLKITDFAQRFGISDRHAGRLLNQYSEELDGHFERRGGAGTWIDDYATDFLRSRLRNPVEIVPAVPDPIDLQQQLNALLVKYAAQAEELAEARKASGEGTAMQLLLTDAQSKVKELDEKVANLESLNGDLRERTGMLSGELETIKRIAESESQEKVKAQNLVADLQKELESLRAEQNRPLTWKERLLGRMR